MLEEGISNRLFNTLDQVTNTIPFYKQFRHLLSGKTQFEETMLTGFPVIDRNFINENSGLFFSEELKRGLLEHTNETEGHNCGTQFFTEATSGTSGARLKCYKGNAERIRLAMSVWQRRKMIDPLVNQGNTYCLLHTPYTQHNVERDLNNCREDEVGEIIVTNLVLRAQPFVRYNQKDMGWLSEKPCACGLKRPVLYLHEARASHYLDGRVNNGASGNGTYLFSKVMEELYCKGYAGIKKYKVYQQQADLFDVYIATDLTDKRSFSSDFADAAKKRLQRRPDFNFSFTTEQDDVFIHEKDYPFISKMTAQ